MSINTFEVMSNRCCFVPFTSLCLILRALLARECLSSLRILTMRISSAHFHRRCSPRHRVRPHGADKVAKRVAH